MADTKRVIALGFFDGVHKGHGELLKMTKRRAAEIGATPSVLSFDVHPDTQSLMYFIAIPDLQLHTLVLPIYPTRLFLPDLNGT